MPCLGVGLTVDEWPELCGVFHREFIGSASVTGASSADCAGYLVACGSSEITETAVVLGLGVHAFHGGQVEIKVSGSLSADGLRKGADGAIPINFQTDFY